MGVLWPFVRSLIGNATPSFLWSAVFSSRILIQLYLQVWSSVSDVREGRLRNRVVTLSYLLHSLLGLSDDVTVHSLLATNHSSVSISVV